MPTGEGIIAIQRILVCVMTKMAALLVLVLAPQGETYNRPDRRSPGGQGALEGLARAIGPFRAVVLVAHVHMIDDSSIDVYACCMRYARTYNGDIALPPVCYFPDRAHRRRRHRTLL